MGVGAAATSAVVYSAVLILVLDAFWAVTWLLGREATSPMKKRMNDAVVGIAVLVVAAGAARLALAWVQQTDFGRRRREVVARVRDVGNTRVGNAVVIRGVVAGTIQAIELAPDGWVHIRMRLDRSVELPADPVVLLNESSLFGEWQASIDARSAIPPDQDDSSRRSPRPRVNAACCPARRFRESAS